MSHLLNLTNSFSASYPTFPHGWCFWSQPSWELPPPLAPRHHIGPPTRHFSFSSFVGLSSSGSPSTVSSFLSFSLLSSPSTPSYPTQLYSHSFNNHQHRLRNTYTSVVSGQTSSWALLTYFCLASKHIYLQILHIKLVRNWEFTIFFPKPVLPWQCLRFLKPDIWNFIQDTSSYFLPLA